MNDSDDYTRLDDPAFLAERRRVREELEHTPESELSPESSQVNAPRYPVLKN